MSEPKLKPNKVRCETANCRKLGITTIRMWGRTYGPYCESHAEEIAESMAKFDADIDERSAKRRAKRP